MVAIRKDRLLNVSFFFIAASIPAVAGTLRARSADPLFRSAVRPVVPSGSRGPGMQVRAASSADPAADDLALILDRMKVDFASPNATYPHDVRASSSPPTQDWLPSLAADGHWPDLESVDRRPPAAGAYSNPATPNFHSNAHLIRLAQMTSAYATPGTPDYHSPKMLEGIEHALAYWYKNHTLSDNWWDNTVGEPQLLSRTLVPLVDVLPPDLLHEGLSYFYTPQMKDPSYSKCRPLLPATTTDSRGAGALRRGCGRSQCRDAEDHQHPNRRRHSARFQFSPARAATLQRRVWPDLID